MILMITSQPHYLVLEAQEYYKQNSSLKYLKEIAINTLIISSLDDPFLDENCYPKDISKINPI